MAEPVCETRFDYKGFPCVVLFMPMGYRCGYVGLPTGHKYYGEPYENIPVYCHCGLTYTEPELRTQDDDYVWWIGFDCAHACDGLDIGTAEKLYAQDYGTIQKILNSARIFEGNPICTLGYCKEQCKWIVDQLASEVTV
jgi:hypothetical protein